MNDYIVSQRKARRFLAPEELAANAGKENVVLDVSSVLVGETIEIGKNNIFYPNVVIECSETGHVTIGDGNTFYPGTFIFCSAGEITIGDGNEFGPAGITLKANVSEARIKIGSGGRYCDGATIMGKTSLGSGSQVLGNITVQNCALAGGGTFQEPDPDKRGAVLKGYGLARNITLQTGDVVNGKGDFSQTPIERQVAYHPKKHA